MGKQYAMSWESDITFPDDERIPAEYRGKSVTVKLGTDSEDFLVNGRKITGYALELVEEAFDSFCNPPTTTTPHS
ncbi:MAG: hypothetical protein ISS36_01750 [Candidatus Aenigmarchaeota archaeon]|nr:hypothetical protein [Candidatus Aenigmarchaeota archaeon]